MRLLLASAAVALACTMGPARAQDTPAAPAADAAPAAATATPEQSTEAPAPASDAAPSAPATAAAAEAAPPNPAPAVVGSVAAPPEGKGQVIFFRPSRLAGMALSFSVHEGDRGVGKLGNGSYFIEVADPGQHTYTIQSEATDKLTLEVDAGETYFVEQTIGMGLMVGRPHLSPSNSAAFEKAKVKLSTKAPSDLKPKV